MRNYDQLYFMTQKKKKKKNSIKLARVSVIGLFDFLICNGPLYEICSRYFKKYRWSILKTYKISIRSDCIHIVQMKSIIVV